METLQTEMRVRGIASAPTGRPPPEQGRSPQPTEGPSARPLAFLPMPESATSKLIQTHQSLIRIALNELPSRQGQCRARRGLLVTAHSPRSMPPRRDASRMSWGGKQDTQAGGRGEGQREEAVWVWQQPSSMSWRPTPLPHDPRERRSALAPLRPQTGQQSPTKPCFPGSRPTEPTGCPVPCRGRGGWTDPGWEACEQAQWEAGVWK